MNNCRRIYYTHTDNIGLNIVVEAKHSKYILSGYGAGHRTKLDKLLSDENLQCDHPDDRLIIYERQHPRYLTLEISKSKIKEAIYIVLKHYNASESIALSFDAFFKLLLKKNNNL